MSENRYLLELLQQVDEEMIYQAGQPWDGRKGQNRRWKGLSGESSGFKRHIGVQAACALLAVMVGIGGIFHEQVAAAIEQFKTQIAGLMENEKDFSPYTEVLNQTQTVNGVSMTLKEVLLNDNRATAVVEVHREDDKKVAAGQAMVYFGSVAIDGEWLDGIMGNNYDMSDGVYLLDEIYEDGQVPKEMSTVELVIQYGEPSAQEKGAWESTATFNFSFKASRSDLAQQMKSIPLDFDLEMADGLKFHFEEMEVSDSVSRIRAVCSRDPRNFYENEAGESYDTLEYGLIVEDDKGNSLNYSPTSYNEKTGEILFDSNYGTPPDADSSSLDLELYEQAGLSVEDFEELETEPSEAFIGGDGENPLDLLKGDVEKIHVELK